MKNAPGGFGTVPSLRQLRCFRLVVELGSIGRAAEDIGMSQPGVSDAVARLEDVMGAPLLVRHMAGSAVAPGGEALSLRVGRLFAQLERGLSSVQSDRAIALRSLAALRMVHLRAHISIAEQGTFTRAADHLHISGAALHRSARDLEKLIGRELYRSGTSGIGVNASGEILARHMRLALYELIQAQTEISHRASDAPARIRVGILPLVPKHWIARVIARTKALYQHAHIELREGGHTVLLQDLRWGTIDMIVGALPPRATEPDTTEEPLFADPYVLVVRRGHPLANRRSISPAMLAKHDWIAPSSELPRRASLERYFAKLPKRPRIRLETNSPGTMMAVLAETDCIALISRTQLQMDGPADLTVLPAEVRDTKRMLGITKRRDWLPTSAQLGFLEALHEVSPHGEEASAPPKTVEAGSAETLHA